MLNFRKLKKDYPSVILDEGRELFAEGKVSKAKILELDTQSMRISGSVLGQFDNNYQAQIEVDREECEVIDSSCNCPHSYDCQHLSALLHYVEAHMEELLSDYSKETDLSDLDVVDESAKEKLIESLKRAENKQEEKREKLEELHAIEEYVKAADTLSKSPFFQKASSKETDKAELAIIYSEEPDDNNERGEDIEIQLALRLQGRSKPLYVPNIKKFMEAIQYGEPTLMGGKKYVFCKESFKNVEWQVLQILVSHVRVRQKITSDRGLRIGYLTPVLFGMVLATAYEIATEEASYSLSSSEDLIPLPTIFKSGLEEPLYFSKTPSNFRFHINYMKPPIDKILLVPKILIDREEIGIEEVELFECAKPGMLHGCTYYRFENYITRVHLRSLESIAALAIPQALVGTFIENALPEMNRMVEVANRGVIDQFATLPYREKLQAKAELSFLDGCLDAALYFMYEGKKVPAAPTHLNLGQINSFISEKGIRARNLVEERELIDELFQEFSFNPDEGLFSTRSEKKIIEFMTDVLPRFQHIVDFKCPQNLLDQFLYDQSTFSIHLKETDRIDAYEIQMKVNGALCGVSLDLLWDCMSSKRAFIELEGSKGGASRADGTKMPKILVLDLERISGVIQVFDELGVQVLDNYTIERPLWSLANIDATQFEGLPIDYSISEKLLDIRAQMLGQKELIFSPVPETVKATLRSYQIEGVQWLERIRNMYLSGILADDMGLGKTLQAIVAISQIKQGDKKDKNSLAHMPILIVCPTSLLYNWKEEFGKFTPHLRVMVIDGVPSQRKKLITQLKDYDVIVTSYTLLQKDVEQYQKTTFSYAILDEAQHIKNRGTRNAKSVKLVKAVHRLILSGTPIENSLDEMWSLFDFLMPGFLSTYDRFVEKYVRTTGEVHTKNIDYLRKKVAPFILRRMKSDVLHDLPPVSELIYHCRLSDVQRELYTQHAESARSELSKLVEKEGFDRVQIHVLATLTRLKQICCHPAIFAKETAEPGDSSKYDMLIELLQTLIEGGHKIVIFSQYTRMLKIMRQDFVKMGITFSYLDGSSKNRLDIVNEFNADDSIRVFLVSLKAGGTGLNLVSADTVIHYDMWWNPAIESQATDRVHRIGQKRSVSTYKLVTLGSIEEKIAEMQERKKGLVKRIVSDDEAIAKLTWEDVLELLKT